MPDKKGKQFYTKDYGTMMHDYENHLRHNGKIQVKKVKEWTDKKEVRVWTQADQYLEDKLWAS